MTLKEKLKARLKELGLNEGLAEIIAITSEDQIEGIVDQLKPSTEEDVPDFNKILSSKEFTDYVAKNGFDKVLGASKTLQSAHDKKVTDGIKSFKEKYFKKIDGEEEDEPKKPKMADDAPEWAKALIAKVESFEKKEQHSTKAEQVKELMSKSKLSKNLQEKWAGRVNVDSEVSFEDQIKALETEEEEFKAEVLGGTISRGLPTGGQPNGKPSDSEIDAVVNNLI